MILLAQWGCTPWEELDDDGDGLTNGEEQILGTDPERSDSDGDGYADNVELDENTSPIDKEDHPYAGGWPIAACRDEVQSTGHAVGEVADDFMLLDQNGETIRLHSFCDRVVLLVGAAFW